jgi:FkbM family methyltransferase
LTTQQQGTIATNTIDGRLIRFFVVDAEDEIQKCHYAGHFYEVEELGIIRSYWRHDGIYVDIGANVGNHIVYVSKFLDASQIIVFEPNPAAIDILRMNLLLNQCTNVDLSYAGIGLGAETSFMRVAEVPYAHNLGGASLLPDSNGNVRCVSGDSLLLNKNVSFFKIDVEGMEMDILKGLDGTIRTWRPNMFIEVFERNCEAFSSWCEDTGYQMVDRFQRYYHVFNFMVVPK